MTSELTEIAELKGFLNRLQEGIISTLKSRRWKIGNAAGFLISSLQGKETKPPQIGDLKNILSMFNKWKSNTNKQHTDIRMLQSWIEEIEWYFESLLNTRRWKLGDKVVSLINRILHRNRNTVPEVIKQIFKECHQWNNIRFVKRAGNGSEIEKNMFAECLSIDEVRSFSGDEIESILRALHGRPVTVIVPIYNAYKDTKKCMDSIFKYTSIPFELLLIDDASSDKRITALLESLKSRENVRVIKNKNNKGFVETANIGMRNSKGDIVLLNSDTLVTPRWLQKLLISAYTEPNVATVTPFSNSAGAFSVPEIGLNNDIEPSLTVCGMARIVERTANNVYPCVPTGNGFCMFVKRQVIEDVGLFNSEKFKRGYGEENDFCMRALKKGWKHVIDDSSFIFHKRASSFCEEKKELIVRNRKILDTMHPEYTQEVQRFVNSPVLRKIRKNISEALANYYNACKVDARRILYVLHAGIGGTLATNADLMSKISVKHECFLLTSDTRFLYLQYFDNNRTWEICRHRMLHSWSAKKFYNEDLRNFYFNVIVGLKIELVHIRHLFKHSFDLPDLCHDLGIPLVFSFHDFYFICPAFHLLNENNTYCAGKCSPNMNQCQVPTKLLSDIRNIKAFIPVWRREVAKIMGYCDAFVTTSSFSKQVYLEVYHELENADFRVIEHGRDFPPNIEPCYEKPRNSKRIKILIPGNIDNHKGLHFIKKLHSIDAKDRLEFHFLGRIHDDLARYGIDHGTYEREQFYNKAASIRPTFVGIFSICPETYCHTLTEAWAAGIPVLALSIGTVKERVNFHKGGWLLDPLKTQQCYDTILSIAEDQDEYQKMADSVCKIQLRSTAEMSTDYEKLYRKILFKQPGRQFHAVKLFTPMGKNGFPGSSYIRTILPLSHEGIREDFSVDIVDTVNITDSSVRKMFSENGTNLVIIQRDAVEQNIANSIISICKVLNIPIVFELDDDILSINRSHSDYKQYKKKIALLGKLCREADAVIVSAPRLKERLEGENQRIEVIGNVLDEKVWFSRLPEPNTCLMNGNKLAIGYVGNFSHWDDLRIVQEVIQEVIDILKREYGIASEFIMVGGFSDGPQQKQWYRRVHIPRNHNEYPKFVDWLRKNVHIDVAVAPLRDNAFNKSKSELKYLEYTALGAVGVYSAVGGYATAIQNGTNGFLVEGNNRDEWRRLLIQLATDEELRTKIHRNAMQDVIDNYLLKNKVQAWKNLFNSLITQFNCRQHFINM